MIGGDRRGSSYYKLSIHRYDNHGEISEQLEWHKINCFNTIYHELSWFYPNNVTPLRVNVLFLLGCCNEHPVADDGDRRPEVKEKMLRRRRQGWGGQLSRIWRRSNGNSLTSSTLTLFLEAPFIRTGETLADGGLARRYARKWGKLARRLLTSLDRSSSPCVTLVRGEGP